MFQENLRKSPNFKKNDGFGTAKIRNFQKLSKFIQSLFIFPHKKISVESTDPFSPYAGRGEHVLSNSYQRSLCVAPHLVFYFEAKRKLVYQRIFPLKSIIFLRYPPIKGMVTWTVLKGPVKGHR